MAAGNATVYVGGSIKTNQQTYNNTSKKLIGLEFHLADPIPTFYGRDKELILIKKAFRKSTDNQYNLVVICGYGGIGKTDLARKYVKENRLKFENIIWIEAGTELSMRQDFTDLLKEITDRGYFCPQLENMYKYLNNEKCIFIFDDAEDMESILLFLPKQNNKSLFLVTSHLKEWKDSNAIIRLDKLNHGSAKNIIEAVLKEYKIKMTKKRLQNLMKKCESVPLVLQITAGYIHKEIIDRIDATKEFDIDDIINNINTEYEMLQEKLPCSSFNLYRKSIFGAISRSFNKILIKKDEVSKLAVDILGISAYLNGNGITDIILKNLFNCHDTNIFDKSLAVLVQYSLIQINVIPNEGKDIVLHRTVQDCIRCHHIKNNKNVYYLDTLPILLKDCYYYFKHHEIIFKNGELHFDLIGSFYEKNKCRILYKRICASATSKIIKYLLEKTDLIRNPEFLFLAVTDKREDINLIQVLKEFNVNLDATNNEGFTAIYFACLGNLMYDIWQNTQRLAENGANINSQNSNGNTVLHNLCELCTYADESIFKRCALIILNGADTKVKNNKQETASEIAEKQGLNLTYKLLTLRNKNDIIHLVAKCLQFDFLEILIEKYICDVNEQDSERNTILHTLCDLKVNDFETEKRILHTVSTLFCQQTVNADIKNNEGKTAEDISRMKRRSKISNLLHYQIPFEENMYHNFGNVIRKFPYTQSKEKNDINYQDKDGNTLLHVICDLEEIDSEQYLLKYVAHLVIHEKAETNIINIAGETVEDVARRRNRLLLADYFERKNNYVFDYDFIEVALKYKNFELAKFIWWRYFHTSNSIFLILHLSNLNGSDISDDDIIYYIRDFHLDQQIMYYDEAIRIAQQNGRTKLADWLIKKKRLFPK